VLAAEGLSDGGVVRDVSFALQAGEVLGLFGLVGAGRTETLEMMFGARPIRSGRIELSGQRFVPGSPRAAIAAGLALVPEGRKSNGILPNRSVAENIAVARVAAASGPAMPSHGSLKRMVADAASRLGIVMTSPQQPIRTLSGGNQQKAILARCLALSPKILLLDEPTHGVDVRTKAQIYDLIRQFSTQGGSVLISSSEMLELFEVADRILVLSGGRITGTHRGGNADPEAIMRDAFLLAGG
ncbi:ATP-binding cassette domain-containing protein, partial [Nostoc sp. NIES-2111]